MLRGRSDDGGGLPAARISEQTFYRWKAKYGGMGPSDAQPPCALDALYRTQGYVKPGLEIPKPYVLSRNPPVMTALLGLGVSVCS